MDRHIGRRVGKVETVLHELVSDELHIDVHHVPSSKERPFEVLVTSGMSELPMNTGEPGGSGAYAELVALLPAGWPLNSEAFADEDNYWPIRLLKSLARFPHKANTWIGFGHTIANEGEPPTPYAESVPFRAAMLAPSMSLGEKFFKMKGPKRRETFFWSVVPLYWEELQFKLENGADALLDRFDEAGVSDRVDPARKSVVPAV